jgi:regulator of protease activity HflC (stomatin/prohibitin superfamily)
VDELNHQTLVTRDGATVTVSVAARWHIRDLLVLVTKVKDPEENVTDVVSGAVGATVPTLDFADLSTRLADAIARDARQKCRGWGIEITDVYVTNLCQSPTLRLLTDPTSNPPGNALAAHVEAL